MVALVGGNPLWVGCAATFVPVCPGLVSTAAIAGARAERWKSHAGWDGENAGCYFACGVASGAGETGGDFESGLSAHQQG